MKLINSSYTVLDDTIDYKKAIELAGRTCYKSEDKITPDSANKFVDMIMKNGHYAMLEHGTIYLCIPSQRLSYYALDHYSRVVYTKTAIFVTTNYRVLVENDWLDDLQYQCEPTEYHEKRISVRFICDRGVANELVRHRVFSFAQESTRFCNYSKDKFGNELTFIIPSWLDMIEGNRSGFEGFLEAAEAQYLDMIDNGFKPQEARQVLPLALKTEIVMTGFASDWERFFRLRCAENVHPDMLKLTIPLRDELMIFLRENPLFQ